MTPVTHRGRRRLEREQPVERLRGLLDDDLLATGHELPDDDRAETPAAQTADAPGRASDPEEEPWVSPIRARLPWATLAIAGVVLILVLVSVLLRGGEQEAVVSSPPSKSAVGGEPAAASATAEGQAPEDQWADDAESGAAAPGPASAGASGAAVTVHVVGEVTEPGVVELPAGSRVADAVEAAGGLSGSAVIDAVNMAAPAIDGVQIVIPDQELAEQWERDPSSAVSDSGGAAGAGGAAGQQAAAQAGAVAGSQAGQSPVQGAAVSGGTIQLNTATAAELEELPKVGPVLAQRIIEHREQIGGFRSIEELDDVSGIGPAMMEAIAPLVTV